MSQEIERATSSDLAISQEQTSWTPPQLAALRQIGVERANPGDLAIFFHQAKRTGLDPFAKQIYMIGRWDSRAKTTKYTIQTGIDGYRLIACRADKRAGGHHGYEDTLWCGSDGAWADVWLKTTPPAAAKVVVVRDGQRFPAIATFSEYAQRKRDGSPTQMWEKMPAIMLAKCAEALALRMAYPQDLSGLYTTDEMGQATNPEISDDAPTHSGLDQCTTIDELRAFYTRAAQSGAPKKVLDEIVAKAKTLTQAAVSEPEAVDEATGEIIEADQAFPSDPGDDVHVVDAA